MAFTVIKASTDSPLTSFNLDGLEYARSVYIVDYKNIQQTAEVIDTSLVQVGIKDKHTDKHLIFPRPFNLWSNDGTTPYATLDALLIDLAVFLGFNRVAGGSVTEGNDADVIYIKGDENTDESLRLIVDTDVDDAGLIEIQQRLNGVWNKTGIEVSGERGLIFGENIHLGEIGNHVEALFPSLDLQAIHPHRHFSHVEGSFESEESVSLAPIVIRSIYQPDDTGEILANLFDWTTDFALQGTDAIITKVYLQVTTAATDNITFHVHRNDVDGAEFGAIRLPASQFAVGEVEIELISGVEDFGGDPIFWQIEVDNGGTVGITSNISQTLPWQAFDFHNEVHEHLAPMEYTTEAIIYDSLTHEAILTTDGGNVAKCPTLK